MCLGVNGCVRLGGFIYKKLKKREALLRAHRPEDGVRACLPERSVGRATPGLRSFHNDLSQDGGCHEPRYRGVLAKVLLIFLFPIGEPSSPPALVNTSTRKHINTLLVPQRIHRIRLCRPHSLITDGQQRNDQHNRPCHNKHKRRYPRPIRKRLHPPVHYPPYQWRG
jgi:hypothetical protein